MIWILIVISLIPFAVMSLFVFGETEEADAYERRAKDQEMARMIGDKFPPFIN